MEREKQKQVEREKDKKDREELLKHKKLEDETPQTKSDDSVPKMPTKSKFVIHFHSEFFRFIIQIFHFENIFRILIVTIQKAKKKIPNRKKSLNAIA